MIEEWNPLRHLSAKDSMSNRHSLAETPKKSDCVFTRLICNLLSKLQRAVWVLFNYIIVLETELLLLNIILAFRVRDGLVKVFRMTITNILYLLEIMVLINYSIVRVIYLANSSRLSPDSSTSDGQYNAQGCLRMEALHESFWNKENISISSLRIASDRNQVNSLADQVSVEGSAKIVTSSKGQQEEASGASRLAYKQESLRVTAEQESEEVTSIFSDMNDSKPSSKPHSYFHFNHRRPHRLRGLDSRSSSLSKQDSKDTSSFENNEEYTNAKKKVHILSTNIFKPYTT